MQGKKILVIDDDPTIRRVIDSVFRKAGAEVWIAASSAEGLRQFYLARPELVLLDIMLPDEDGWSTCRQIRKFSDVPIIMLTALQHDEDIIHGLDAGADDFISKPFNGQVLLARARAIFRRLEISASFQKSPSYNDGYLSVDLKDYRILIAGKPVKLTPTEFRLLAYLLENPGRVLSVQNILENVWGPAYMDSSDYVHVYMSHLRQKIEADPRRPKYLITEYGVGYRFEKNGRDH